jgi:hypothetical protein
MLTPDEDRKARVRVFTGTPSKFGLALPFILLSISADSKSSWARAII